MANKREKKGELLSSTYGSLKIRNRTPLERSRREKLKKFKKENLFGSAYGSLRIWDRTPLPPSVRYKNLQRSQLGYL